MSFSRFRLVSLPERERGGERKREGEMRKEFEERERGECPNLFSLLVERARRPMSLGGAEGSPTLN